MAVGTPTSTKQVEDRIKVDVQRTAPDSDPYLRVHWLRSFIAGIARRIYDFYFDLRQTEKAVMPDTATTETAPRWGNIYIGAPNTATSASGNAIAQGTIGKSLVFGDVMTAGENEYTVTSGGTIASNVVSVQSITRSGQTATVTTASDHNLASAVPVTIAGAVETEYNVTDTAITVTGLDSFTYQVVGTPTSPATGVITSTSISAMIGIESSDFGSSTNLELDTPLTLQSPIVGVNDTLNVSFGEIGGGSDNETTADYKARYLDKIRNPVAHFNEADITANAKEINGVTRVFVQPANFEVGTQSVTSITRVGNVATVTTAAPHGYDDGQVVSVFDADQSEYDVVRGRIIVETTSIFHYVVTGTPTTPATGVITCSSTVALGQCITYFMRDNDDDAVPTASEVTTVKTQQDTIKPANTSTDDNLVKAPISIPMDFDFTALSPNTETMRTAIDNNLIQFFAEQTFVGVDVDEDSYRAAIKNTVDPATNENVVSFDLSAPVGDFPVSVGGIATKGAITWP